MSENHRSQVGPDRIRIDLEADWEVSYWTRKLSISRHQLAQAMETVGDKAHDIVGYFRKLELEAEEKDEEERRARLAKLDAVAH